jgi:hypothetical protein
MLSVFTFVIAPSLLLGWLAGRFSLAPPANRLLLGGTLAAILQGTMFFALPGILSAASYSMADSSGHPPTSVNSHFGTHVPILRIGAELCASIACGVLAAWLTTRQLKSDASKEAVS